MDDDSSDILGQQTKPALHGSSNYDSPGASLTVKLVFGFAMLLLLYVVFMRIWFRVLVWKERSYKLAMRRRHGIPDNDHRPFNVAYAAVVRARQEKEAVQKSKVTQIISSSDRQNAQTEGNVRQRFGSQAIAAGEAPRAHSHSSRLPGAFLMEGTPVRFHPESLTPPPVVVGGRRYSSQSHWPSMRRDESGATRHLNGVHRPSRRRLEFESLDGGQEHGFVEDPADRQDTIGEVERDDRLIGNGVDDAAWRGQVLPPRGAKRYLFEEDENEEDLIARQSRDKRARKVSLDKSIQAGSDDLNMEIDEDEDEDGDLPDIQRGKKRDRAEAGSTFGGDDDDSGIELDSPDSKPQRRTRKRRTCTKRSSDTGMIRGQKRDRDIEEEGTDFESGDENPHVLRKKRGKKSTWHDEELSELSTTRSQTSSGSRNRAIGDEWISNGIRWKVGPNGQRLRQALVKRSTQKYPMPDDSQHPDRSVDFEVYVESWLNDEEYRDAKQRHILAGQDTPPRFDTKLALEVQSQANGKNLLWSSTSTPLESPVSRSPISERALGSNQRNIKTSLVSSSASRTNPFEQLPTHGMKRISSISRTASAGIIGSSSLADSISPSPHIRYKTYSKLEKQELEAQALMKLRDLKSKKEAESHRPEVDQIAKQNPETDKGANKPFTIPTITVTTPSDASGSTSQPGSLPDLPNSTETLKSGKMPKPQPLVPFPSSIGGTKSSEAAKLLFFPTASSSALPSATQKPDEKSTVPGATQSSLPTTVATATQSAQGLFGIPGSTSTASGSKTELPAKSPSLFNISSSTTMAPTHMVPQPDINSAKSMLPNSKLAETKISTFTPTSQPTNSSPSLMSRLGPLQSNTSSNTAAMPSQSASIFSFSKPNNNTTTVDNRTPNPLATQPSQSTSQPAQSGSSAAPGSQPKFNFNFTGPTNTPTSFSTVSFAAKTKPAPAATSAAPPGGLLESKTLSRPMVTFTPLTPDGGTKDSSKSVSAAKNPFDSSSFGSKPPGSGMNGDASKPPIHMSGTTGEASNALGVTSASNTANVFGMMPSTNSTESKPGESSSIQPTKPLFKFGVTGGQIPSSSKDVPASSDTSAMFGAGTGASAASTAPRPVPTSSSLFGALGPQPTNAFGPTTTNLFGAANASSPNTTAPMNMFGSSSGSGSTPSNVFSAPSASTSSNTQPPNIFGGAGTNGVSGTTAMKPEEAPKSVFGVTSTPGLNATLTSTSEQPKQVFSFRTTPSSNNTNQPNAFGLNSKSSSGSPFTFNFTTKNLPGSPTSQTPVFGAISGGQPTFASKPSAFNVGSTFGPTAAGSSS